MSDQYPVRTRRSYSRAFKLQVVAETREPGVSVAAVARRHGMNANVVFHWLRDRRFNAAEGPAAFLPVEAGPAAPLERTGLDERIDLVVELAEGARIPCRDTRSLRAVLRALRQTR